MQETVQFEREGYRWTAVQWLARIIDDPSSPPIERPEDYPGSEVVKRGLNRAVYRLPINGEVYYLKQMFPSGPFSRAWARYHVRLEWRMSCEARERGMPAPEPVAKAEGPMPLFITRAVPNGVPLDEYLYDSCFEASDDEPEFPGARPPEFVSVYRRRRPGSSEIVIGLARPLAVLLATLYRAGAYFSDLHPGNILLVREPEPVLYLTDLGRLTFRAPHDALLRHLVRMNNYFAPITTQTERFHFWKSLGEYHDLPIPRLEQIEKATERYRLGTYRRRDRRWRGFNKYVAHVSVGPWRGRAVTDWRDNIQRALQASPDPFAHDGAVVIKHSQSSTVAEVNWGGRWPVIIKRDNRGGFRRWFKRLVVPSRTWRGWLKGHWLLMRGVATARPVAVLRRKGGWSLDNSLLATEKLRDSVALDKWWRQSQTPRHRRRIVEQLARFVRRLHNLGISQRDLKAQNILVQMRSPDYHQLYLIDLDGLKFRRRVSHRRKVQNVMRLNVSADEVGVISCSQRLRFLRSYMRASPGGMLPSVSFRRWGVQKESVRRMRRFWRQVAEASARKWAKLAIRQREMLARRTAAGR